MIWIIISDHLLQLFIKNYVYCKDDFCGKIQFFFTNGEMSYNQIFIIKIYTLYLNSKYPIIQYK